MNSQQLQFIAEGGTTQTERFIEILKWNAGSWVGLPQLVEYCHGYAIHSRAADARKRGLHIENKTERDPATGQRKSFYRLMP